MSTSDKAKKTCLYDFHRDRQAKMELFAGYSMPIVYKNQTIKSEHMQTRERASAFDVSHMMQVFVRGKDRYKFIESLTVADLQGMKFNKCTLSVFTNQSGGIIDDCIIGKREDHMHLVSNAGNADTVWQWLVEHMNKDLDVHVERLEDRGLIALQGPLAAKVLQTLVGIDLKAIKFMTTIETEIRYVGVCIVTRCGYTGEDGFEISVEPTKAKKLMEILCQNNDVEPAGLGARDTLRLEAGLCLHGHDITDKTTPIEAALNWVVAKRRRQEGGFPGYDIVAKQLKEGSKVKRVGLVAKSAGPPAREGSKVKDSDGSALGVVTSGTFAPKLEKNIAMAYLPTHLSKEMGRKVVCEVRGKLFDYELTKMPFVKSNYYI
jgi:aminomethyltransferase